MGKVGQTLANYDEFMNTMEADINGLTDKYEREQDDLAKYQKEFSDVMAWRDERNRREEAERQEMERKRAEDKLKYDSATLIQHSFRRYKDKKSGGKKKKKKK